MGKCDTCRGRMDWPKLPRDYLIGIVILKRLAWLVLLSLWEVGAWFVSIFSSWPMTNDRGALGWLRVQTKKGLYPFHLVCSAWVAMASHVTRASETYNGSNKLVCQEEFVGKPSKWTRHEIRMDPMMFPDTYSCIEKDCCGLPHGRSVSLEYDSVRQPFNIIQVVPVLSVEARS